MANALMAIALKSCSFGTSVGIMDERTGEPTADAVPAMIVAKAIHASVARPVETNMAVAAMIAAPASCVVISRRRRSRRSAHTPAWSVMNTAGRPRVNAIRPCSRSPRLRPSSTNHP